MQVKFYDPETEATHTAKVLINDPFAKELQVEVISETHPDEFLDPIFVAYELLRSMPRDSLHQVGNVQETDDAEDAPQLERLSTKKKTQAKADQPATDMSTLLQCEDSEIVPLTYVPCQNGILKSETMVVYRGQDCTVTNLEFKGRSNKAFATIVSVDDEDEVICLPAVKLITKKMTS